MRKIDLSIIYVYYNTPKELLSSLQSITYAIGSLTYEVIIVNNASPKALPKTRIKKSNVKIICNKKNEGFGKAINQAADLAEGEILLFINPDTLFHKDAIVKLYKRLTKDKKIGLIGPKITGEKGEVLDSIGRMPFLPRALFVFSFLGRIWPFNKIVRSYYLSDLSRSREHKVEVISGACMMIRASLFSSIGGFDERFFMYFEEADISYRVRKKGLRVLYFPSAIVTHFVGRSSSNKEWIKKIFEQSRFSFFKKYHGSVLALLAEGFLRIQTFECLLLLLILALSAFLNLYKIDEQMMFFGDFGRDYLAARDFLLTRNIPLVGITSSVTWLHQGPLSIYFIALMFLLSNFHPVAPAIFYALLGVGSTLLVFILGKIFFSHRVGLLASAFYATSPLIIINARIPYHTSPIPFFACLFFILLFRVLTNQKKYLLLLFFLLGLLLQLELANAVIVFILIALYFLYRPKFTERELIISLAGFFLGILPFILYDITNGFKQTLGFPLWVLNRIRLFFGLTFSHSTATTINVPGALSLIINQLKRAIFPFSWVIVLMLTLFIPLSFWMNKKAKIIKSKKGIIIVVFWISIPLIGYLIHASPGTAYFPLIFPPLALLIGWSVYLVGKKFKLVYFLFAFVIAFNAWYTVYFHYFLDSENILGSRAPGWNYGLGPELSEQKQIADFIVSDAKGKPFRLVGKSFLAKYESSIDNYKYLVWYRGGILDDTASITYNLYLLQDHVPNVKKVFENKFLVIIKNE